jgi:hypothetical protein
MPTTSSWQLRKDTPADAPNAASATMGSQEREIKHTKDLEKMWSGSRKLLASEGPNSRVLEVPLSPRDERVPCEASESLKAVEDFQGRL